MVGRKVLWSAVACAAVVFLIVGVALHARRDEESDSAASDGSARRRDRREAEVLPESLRNITTPTYDYIVVGSGPGGGVVA